MRKLHVKEILIVDKVGWISLALVMLDLECESLIIEMFEHLYVEASIILLLQETDNIFVGLLPILYRIRRKKEKSFLYLGASSL